MILSIYFWRVELWTIARSNYEVGMTEMGTVSYSSVTTNVIGVVLIWCQIVV